MSRTYSVPTRNALIAAENIADDACAKVLDIPTIFYPAVVIAVYRAALYDDLPSDVKWSNVYDAVDDHLEQLFENVTLFTPHGDVIAIDENFPMVYYDDTEMYIVIKYLTETIIDALSEYDLESNDDWLSLAEELRHNLAKLPYRTSTLTDDIVLQLSRKMLFIIPRSVNSKLDILELV